MVQERTACSIWINADGPGTILFLPTKAQRPAWLSLLYIYSRRPRKLLEHFCQLLEEATQEAAAGRSS